MNTRGGRAMGACVPAQDRVQRVLWLREERRSRSSLLNVSYLIKTIHVPTVSNVETANYFSFPSFEDFQEYHEDQERRESRQENGVP
ncbi:uncharacterized protein LY89DRAFT_682835 [Mollisia scopiformis]|uniref:Uncharacterized protein n=1 Tax=Mollisia scopiformis TaxID=149040 RepID=A0A194XIP5_MOLSC|nr:uncharacterized protein LY89DRAFT_682835 [Mollisia scopiformis]KUJ20033.1 hypothetical protein LY89DRAFT_682835 [Mollisia scopiformis]